MDEDAREVICEQQENDAPAVSRDVLDSGRPGRRTSKVWSVFNRLSDNNAQCSQCNRVLSFKSSVTNLAKHIQRKHPATYTSLEMDIREGLKEFITIDTGRGEVVTNDDEGEDDSVRTDDPEWNPPSKMAKRSVSTPKKIIKKEVISSNGVDYVIYTQDPPEVTRPTTTTKKPLISKRPTVVAARSPVVCSTPVVSSPARQVMPQIEEDEFAAFARFLSQRIRSLKSPYWQSCAINEINSALHRIEMRRYEMPRVDSAQQFAQTDPLESSEVQAVTENHAIHEAHHVVEVISQDNLV